MGMKNLPLDCAQTVVKVFEQFGWVPHRGNNHYVLTHIHKRHINLSIPDHKEIDRALLRAQIKKAGITEDQFVTVYKRL